MKMSLKVMASYLYVPLSFILFLAISSSVSKSARKRRGLYVVEKIENGLKKYYLVQKKTLPNEKKRG